MENAKVENWLNVVLGLWVFITPWAFLSFMGTETSTSASWNFWLVGAFIVLSAAMALGDLKPWEEWVSLAFGLWLVISPWVFGYSSDVALMWNSAISGVAVAVLSGLALPEALKLQQQSH